MYLLLYLLHSRHLKKSIIEYLIIHSFSLCFISLQVFFIYFLFRSGYRYIWFINIPPKTIQFIFQFSMSNFLQYCIINNFKVMPDGQDDTKLKPL